MYFYLVAIATDYKCSNGYGLCQGYNLKWLKNWGTSEKKS